MGTLLPNFLLSDVEDEFFFSSGKDAFINSNAVEQISLAFYSWYDDSLVKDDAQGLDAKFPLLVSGRGFRQNIFIQSDGKLIMI